MDNGNHCIEKPSIYVSIYQSIFFLQEGHALLETEGCIDNPSPKHDLLVNQTNNSTEIVSPIL